MFARTLESGQTQTLSVKTQRYSPGETYDFIVSSPDKAYIDTLYNYPQGFRTDILAFDIFCWDEETTAGERYYEIKDNWIYFKSANVDYTVSADIGQPNKTFGYGIPLPGSGHSSAPENETLAQLIIRINSNPTINRWFYVNLRFTRDDQENPGYFEYNYFPNYHSDVPKSYLDHFFLRNDNVITVVPGSGYPFTSSSYTIDDVAKTLDMSCDWEYYYNYTEEYLFASSANDTLGELETSINNGTAPEIVSSIFEANVIGGYSLTDSTDLLPTGTYVALTTSYTNLKITGNIDAFQLRLRAATGANFDIDEIYYRIPAARDRIEVRCRIKYNSSFSLSSYDLSVQTLGGLATYISGLIGYADPIFTTLFSANTVDSYYDTLAADRLISDTGAIDANTVWESDLSDIIGMQILNMKSEGEVIVDNLSFNAVTDKPFSTTLPSNKDLHTWIEGTLTGNYSVGLTHLELLPIKRPSVTYGWLAQINKQLVKTNEPTHVYFGIMGDIRFIQISDHNLHTQLNYVKERLGKPWKNDLGIIVPDYYTPERYDQNNPYAINIDNFLGYLRTTRYNQIRNSIINEAVVSNKYFWLYMKFHREFGCDQKAITLKDQIEKNEEDQDTVQSKIGKPNNDH